MDRRDLQQMVKSDQPRWKRFDSGRAKHDIYQQQEYGTYFRTKFLWDYYLTLTFSRDVSSEQATALVNQYLREVEEKIRAPLSCLIAKEQTYSGLGKPTGRVHFHLLLSCSTTLTREFLRDQWQVPKYGGDRTSGPSACVLPYDTERSATYYLFKNLHRPSWDWAEWRLQGASLRKPKSFATSSAARRAWNRNQDRQRNSAALSIGSPRVTPTPVLSDGMSNLLTQSIDSQANPGDPPDH
jgi:hypothetical protein